MASRPREQAAVTAAILGRRAPAASGRGEGQREHRWDHTHPWDCSVEPEVARGGSATRAPAVAAVRQQPPARIGLGRGAGVRRAMVRALAFTARTGKAWRLGTVAVGKLQLAGHGERALSTMAATSACGWRARERVESEPETTREAEGRVNEARAL